nr:unnamed protein product [Callosobruchus chinensis]
MMLKMGWGGKGLGSQEQGEEKTVAELITENITKEGLGSKNVMEEIDRIMREFAHSTKLSTIAAKYNLKSKSEGKDENRRITISKKMDKWNIVRELLRGGLENESYKLQIPEKFKYLWTDELSSDDDKY